MLRAAAIAERLGIPTVSIVASAFLTQGKLVSKALRIPFTFAEYLGAPMVDSDHDLILKVKNRVVPDIIKGLNGFAAESPVESPVDSEPEPGEIVYNATFSEVIDYFHERLWTDGLPIIPPTRERVEEFLKFTPLSPEHVIGVLPQEEREASILSIATNAVMAGCKPAYMPILVAAVEAIADKNFHLEDAGSTPGWEPLVIVSGPVARVVGLNSESGVMKIGNQANSTIGRFLRLYMRNICGYRTPPGDGDKASIGYTFNVALAENEEYAREIGWTTFGSDQGYSSNENVVTVQSVVCISPPTYSAGTTAISHVQQFVDVIGRTFSYWGYRGLKRGHMHPLIVIGPSIAKVIANEWTKDDVRDYIWKNTTLPVSLIKNFARQTAGMELELEKLVQDGLIAPDYIESDDPERHVRVFVNASEIGILIAGDPGRNQSRGYLPNADQGMRTSKKIRLPKNWDSLIEDVF